jgi:hypothetical protein
MSKIITLFLLLISCYSCTHHGNFLYETDSMYLGNADSGGEKITDEGIDSVSGKRYAVKMVLHNKVTDYEGKNKDVNESNYRRKYYLTELKIYTLQNYNQSHPANSDISEYFIYSKGSKYTVNYMVEKDGLSYPQSRPNPEEEFEDSYYFRMMAPPDSTGYYSFKIRLQFADESSFTDTTRIKLFR